MFEKCEPIRPPSIRQSWRLCLSFVVAIGVAAWVVYLLLQRGDAWDEAEHAHAAWLIGSGKRPLEDFFQHHQPLLWSCLALYYRVGFGGAGVLVWGRICVAACGIACVFALLQLQSAASEEASMARRWLGVLFFVAATAVLHRLFVIRPETLSAAAMLLALALWNRAPAHAGLPIFLAGCLAGASVYASPRFAVLAGLFLLLGHRHWRRWMLFGAGATSFMLLYSAGSGFTLADSLFVLRFSEYLQSVGVGSHGPPAAFWMLLLLTTLLPLSALLIGTDPSARREGAALIVNGLLVFLLCSHFAGGFRYDQAYAPFIVAAAVAAARIGAAFEPERPRAVPALMCALLMAGVGSDVLVPYTDPAAFDFLDSVRARDLLAGAVPSGEKVLVFAVHHPIAVPDASYYGTPLADGQDRLCRAVEGFQGGRVLPRCDFFAILSEQKPFLIDTLVWRAAPLAEVEATRSIIAAGYRPLVPEDSWWRSESGRVFNLATLVERAPPAISARR